MTHALAVADTALLALIALLLAAAVPVYLCEARRRLTNFRADARPRPRKL